MENKKKKTTFNVCTTPVGDFICLYLHKQIFRYIYEKVDIIKLKNQDYFQNIIINVVFLLNIFLFYI